MLWVLRTGGTGETKTERMKDVFCDFYDLNRNDDVRQTKGGTLLVLGQDWIERESITRTQEGKTAVTGDMTNERGNESDKMREDDACGQDDWKEREGTKGAKRGKVVFVETTPGKEAIPSRPSSFLFLIL